MRRLQAKLLFFISVLLMMAGAVTVNTYAAGPLDEIVDYEIDATVNDDATVTLVYHIEWKVLDSDSEGPLSWVRVGIPNRHYGETVGLTDNIKSIGYDSDGGSYMRIDFDRKYYKDEVVVFEFSVVQDYMCQVDKLQEGYTVYSFTPGWFDDIAVDSMTLRWNADKADSWDPECLEIVGKLIWMKHNMAPGEKMTIHVTYPNDAYGFDLSKSEESGKDDAGDWFYIILGLIAMAVCMGGPILVIWGAIKIVCEALYRAGAAFGGSAQKKITRTKIVYYETCPGCGAARRDGQTKCEFCGRSMIKSEERIEEKDIKGSEKEAAKFNKEGEFRYTESPNTYIKVHVVPISRPARTYSSGRSRSHHSSCAHSSCACACACACAGGGRAGCSTKEFYKGKTFRINMDK
jgi:hypothetical protein